jgi:hypothetical protein
MEEEVTAFLAGGRPDRSGGTRDLCEAYRLDIPAAGPRQPKESGCCPHEPARTTTRKPRHGTKKPESNVANST